jgi:hypothetical protein
MLDAVLRAAYAPSTLRAMLRHHRAFTEFQAPLEGY